MHGVARQGFGETAAGSDASRGRRARAVRRGPLLAGVGLVGFVAAAAAAPTGAAEDARLADVAERGRAAEVRMLVATGGADVNARQVDGMTALHWAVYHDDAGTAELLIVAGADISAENRYGVRPISLAAMNRNGRLVGRLLRLGADPNATLRGGETVLMTAARTGSLEAVEALLAYGADPNALEERRQTALMWAAAEGHAAVVQALVEAGADLGATLDSGFTPMFFAVREGRIGVVRTLLAAGVEVDAVLERVTHGLDRAVNNASYRPVDDGMSPLLLAVRNGHFELAVALVKAGADPNDRRTGFTPLHTVSWVRKPDASDRGDPAPIGSGALTSLQFVRALVALGADVNGRLGDGTPRPPHTASRVRMHGATPFLMAADRADLAFMRQLLELGADPMLGNADETTPLMAAAGFGTTAPLEEAGTEAEAHEAVTWLLALGADLDAVDLNGNTAMHGAAYGNFPTVVDLLVAHGADPVVWHRTNDRGLTPLFIAEGYRGGGFKLSRPTTEAMMRVMAAAGLSTDGPRPPIRDIYERPAPRP